MEKDDLFWIWFAGATATGTKEAKMLLEIYGSPYELYQADESELNVIPKLSERSAKKLANKDLGEAAEIAETCQRLHISLLRYSDPQYPECLREIDNPPVLLYYFGKIPDWEKTVRVGIVGTRQMSESGLRISYRISYGLALAGIVTVSGMAEGIDGVSAAATMDAGGFPVAVLGCGLDQVYPKHHRPLMTAIARNGLLLSEYPPGTKPIAFHFPLRNRIISGLCQGVLVAQAGEKSGSLITAREAVRQGRDLFAVPSEVGARESGTNELLRDGAKIALDCFDVIEQYRYFFSERLMKIPNPREIVEPNLNSLRAYGVLPVSKTEWQPGVSAPAKTDSEGEDTFEKTFFPQPECQKEKNETKKDRKIKKIRKKPEDAKSENNFVSKESGKKELPDNLTPLQKEILEMIPDGEPISGERLFASGHPYGETVTAITMLEIQGLVEKLPGSCYRKK